jgi:hypothetical protein
LIEGLAADERTPSYDLENKKAIFDPNHHFVGTWDCNHATKGNVRTAYFAGRYIIDPRVREYLDDYQGLDEE